MSERSAYVLGSDDAEIARLDAQAGSPAGATEALLRAAGIGGAMRVLDLGTGLGHVAFMVADLLDPGGSVLGVDRAERLPQAPGAGRGGGRGGGAAPGPGGGPAARGRREHPVPSGGRADVQRERAVRRDRGAP